MRFSVIGFLVGAVCAIIFFVVATALIVFNHSTLIFALIAFIIWALLTLNWPDRHRGTTIT
jgi:hypothetical protein